MPDSYFVLLRAVTGGNAYRCDPATAGPWHPEQQHGGPPSALLVHAAEAAAAQAAQRDDLIAMRYAAEFVGPVPVADVVVTTTLERQARSAILVRAELSAGDRVCLRARVWLVRPVDTTGIAEALPVDVPNEPPVGARGLDFTFPYGQSIEWRVISGGLSTPGPGSTWARPLREIVPGHPLSGLQRAVLIGDSASGVSAELDWARWTFLNVDLDVHLARPPRGDWLFMDARTQLGTHGAGLATSVLSDLAGPVGRSAQTLVIAPRA